MSTATAIDVPAGPWSVDPVHSRVEFEIEHLGLATFRGGFADYSAQLATEDGALIVEGSARADSVTIDDEDLRTHLLSPDFFDAERHPEIGFRSADVQLAGEGGLTVTGELTMRGISRAITATGRIGEVGVDPGGNRRIPVTLEATLDRGAFGLDWNAELPNGNKALADDVRLTVSLELVEEAS